MNDLNKAVENIAFSLKKDGLLLTAVYFETRVFFGKRVEQVTSSKWSHYFEGFALKPFHFEPNVYRNAFREYFKTILDS